MKRCLHIGSKKDLPKARKRTHLLKHTAEKQRVSSQGSHRSKGFVFIRVKGELCDLMLSVQASHGLSFQVAHFLDQLSFLRLFFSVENSGP